MIITKYFNLKDWDRYEAGSFKIGTLEEYRKSEQEVARMSDTDEGIAQRGFGEGNAYIKHMVLPGNNVIENCTFIDCGTIVKVDTVFNEFVFCASKGGYDQGHHIKMVEGELLEDGLEYNGNEDLNCYAEIELSRFLKGLRFWGFGSEKVLSKLSPQQYIIAKPVSYEPRLLKKELKAESIVDDGLTEEMYFSTIFNKPIKFSTEREFRIVLSALAPRLPSSGVSALYPQSSKLRKSILRMGRL